MMTIKDIANICGVAPSTVSKVLNNKDESISAETRKRILDAIREYQYKPYSRAINSYAAKRGIIGVLFSGRSIEAGALIYEIERLAMAGGFSIMPCNTQETPDGVARCLAILEGKGVDGIIALYQDAGFFLEVSVPVVFVSEERGERRAPNICFDPEKAGYLAASCLLEKGHDKIGIVLAEGDDAVEAGCLRVFRERGVAIPSANMHREREGDAVAVASGCLHMDITAVVCGDAETAYYIYAKLRERGDSVPGDLSVVSARDGRLAAMLVPPLTAVSAPCVEMAEAAVKALIDSVEGRADAVPANSCVALAVEERGSVAAPARDRQGKKIVVVGSMNMNCVLLMDHVPAGGETVLANGTALIPGGKGANQAAGAGKLGGLVYMVGRLGNDSDGKVIYNSLLASGVRMDAVTFDSSMPTGRAYVQVPSSGESTIAVYPGANSRLDGRGMERYEPLFKGAGYCLISTEIPRDAVERAACLCAEHGVKVIVKPSAVTVISDGLLGWIDYLVPNEKELNRLVPGDTGIEAKAASLLDRGVGNVLVTLGERGCHLYNRSVSASFPAAGFNVVDTTWAADAFISALAVRLSEGGDILQSIGFATYAAAISITRPGVQPAMPDRRGLDIYQDDILNRFKPLSWIEKPPAGG